VPWIGAMEATLFTGGWRPPAALRRRIEGCPSRMLKAITAAKKKNDAADAEKIADLLRCILLPEC